MPNYSPNSNQDQALRTSALRRVVGFTFIELLAVMAIISLLSAAILVALTELQATSKKRRCQQQIKKIDQLIMQRWDEILHKPLPIQLPSSLLPVDRKRAVLIARRELLRLELPERITDIFDGPYFSKIMPTPATTRAFQRKALFITRQKNNDGNLNQWTEQHQGAECLYLILSVMQDRDSSALDFFFPGEIGDTDGDGMLEILDGFNQPIGFLRWAPGISGPFSDIQKTDATKSPDATDMGEADYRLLDVDPSKHPFNLLPLIMSAGRDGEFGTFGFGKKPDVSKYSYSRDQFIDWLDNKFTPKSFRYLQTEYLSGKLFPSDPYWSTNWSKAYGAWIDDTILDNISNHQIEVNP
ncbi:MAG: prepilin-type N-terminal cleavage/methylation domain-containing protein [Planctomycetaceae bacterium]|nr:prepilin-type N-terminal cleavage/methylation domain-containing protein [Planctomycetaceae bacterium]